LSARTGITGRRGSICTLGIDFAGHDLDQPLREMRTEASQGLMAAMTSMMDGDGFTLREAAMPAVVPGFEGRWISDKQGQPIIHVQAYNPERHEIRPGGVNGTIDHIALTCADFEGTKRRCEELGVDYRVNDRQFGDLRQVFITDPNEIRLELNFAED
jgi:hypothetical protein